MSDVTRAIGQALTGHRIVKIFSGQEFEQNRFDQINRRNFRLHLKLVGTRALGDALTQYVVALGVAAIVFFVFSGWLNEEVDSPAFIGFVTAIGILLAPLKRLINTNAALQRGIVAGDSLFALLDELPEPSTGGVRLVRCSGDVEYDSVEFHYGDDNAVLSGLSFRVPAGTTAAFVGQSGSGKSTLVSLLPRFYSPEAGQILLDGTDIATLDLADLRRQISFVGQDVVLFDDTIAGNIAYGGLAGTSRAEIERAAEAAYVLEFANELPDGLDAAVGERGSLLSGGQRQRIAIARALLKNAPILILDDERTDECLRLRQARLRLMAARKLLLARSRCGRGRSHSAVSKRPRTSSASAAR
jgi:subfamily B ATP-binding cassette protein MsbA